MSEIRKAVGRCLRNISDRQVVIGPNVWRPSDGLSPKAWYFIVATCEAGRGFRSDQMSAGPGYQIDDLRRDFIAELSRQKPPLVVHLCEDELYAARLCRALWPGERVARALLRRSKQRGRAHDGRPIYAFRGSFLGLPAHLDEEAPMSLRAAYIKRCIAEAKRHEAMIADEEAAEIEAREREAAFRAAWRLYAGRRTTRSKALARDYATYLERYGRVSGICGNSTSATAKRKALHRFAISRGGGACFRAIFDFARIHAAARLKLHQPPCESE